MLKTALKLILLITLVVVDVFLIDRLVNYRASADTQFKEHLQQVTNKAAKDIDDIVAQVEDASKSLAGQLGKEADKEALTPPLIKNSLLKIITKNDFFYGASITFKPYAFSKYRRLFSIYADKSGGENDIKYQQLDDIYDYTLPEHDWYVEAIEKGDKWSKPYWDEAGKTYMITYSALFYKNSSKEIDDVLGMVTIDMSMATLRNIIESLNLDASGFGALTTKDGDYLYHPNYQYVREHLNLLDIAREKNDKTRLAIAPLVKQGKSGVVDHVSTTTNEKTWLFYQPIPSSGWSLQNTYFKSDIDISESYLRQQLILVAVTTLLSIVLLLITVLPGTMFGYTRLTVGAAISSLFLIFCIWFVWWLALTYNDTHYEKGAKKVVDQKYLEALITDYRNNSREKNLEKTHFVPTGVQIETIDFSSPNDIAITGRLWQTYSDDYPTDWVRGFELGRSTKLSIDLTEKQKIDGGELLYWRFQASIRTNLDYSRYPLEIENISIPIYPKKHGSGVAIVPDLKAYKFISPGLLPGLTQNIFVPGWNITESYFSFAEANSRSNLGANLVILIKNNFT